LTHTVYIFVHLGFTGSPAGGPVNTGVYTSRSTTQVWPQSPQFTPDTGNNDNDRHHFV